MQIDNGTLPLLKTAANDNLVALDIGFASQSNDSCGIAQFGDGAIQSRNSTYGETISFLRGWPLSELHLIVEAPLFFVFDQQGNPVGRLPLEDPPHYWYLRAGITVAFSAVNLFHELLRAKAQHRLIIYEGYLPHFHGARRQPHALDAAELLAAARKQNAIVKYERSEFHGIVRSVHYYLGLPEPENLPPVVEPKRMALV